MDICRVDLDTLLFMDRYFHAHARKQFNRRRHISQMWDVPDYHTLIGQDRRRQDR
jgi:hypothetical protein